MALPDLSYRAAKREVKRLVKSLKNMAFGRKEGEAEAPYWRSAEDKLKAREKQLQSQLQEALGKKKKKPETRRGLGMTIKGK